MEDKEKFCRNCKKNVAAVNYVIHQVHCERNIQLCQLCHEPVPRSDLDYHLKEEHSLTKCSFCKLTLEKWTLDFHQSKECRKRPVNCKYCDLNQPFDLISEHETSCGSRTDECSFCNGRFLLKDKEAHLRACQKETHHQSMYSCKDCGEKLSEEEFAVHDKHCFAHFKICRQCNESVKISELEEHFEICSQKNKSLERQARSKYYGSRVAVDNVSKQEESCEYRSYRCSNSDDHFPKQDKEDLRVSQKKNEFFCTYCEEVIYSENEFEHVRNCVFRLEKCMICGELVKHKDLKEHMKSRCKKKNEEPKDDDIFMCEHCERKFPSNILANHEKKCELRCVKCTHCYDFVKYVDLERHFEVCGKIKNYQSKVACEHCGTKFPSDMLPDHESNCDLHCEKCQVCFALVKNKDMTGHLNICEQRNIGPSKVSCQHCEIKFPIKSIENHEVNCRFRPEKCSACNDVVPMKDMDNHRRVCEQENAKQMPVFCTYCELEFPAEEFDYHEAACGAKTKKCFSCNRFIKQRNFDLHKTSCGDEIESDACPIPCDYCSELFPLSLLELHMEVCQDRIERCLICNQSVNFKDRYSHKETCKASVEEMCAVCSLSFPKVILADHVTQCVAANSECSNHFLKAGGAQHFQMQSDNSIGNANNSLENVLRCPYCSEYVPKKRFDNHKKYCKKALRECPICDDTYHVDETEEHKMSCDASDKILCQESAFSMDLHNKYETLQSEETLREKESSFEICPFCEGKISVSYYDKHLELCSHSVKQCLLCKSDYPKDSEKEHFQLCSGLTKNYSEAKNCHTTKCSGCQKYIPQGAMESHLTSCSGNKKCVYCDKVITGNMHKHFTRCHEYKKIQQSALPAKDTGTKPKKKNSQEKENPINRFIGTVKNIFTGSEKSNSDHFVDSPSNQYPFDGATASAATAPPAEDIEHIYMNCEFCNEKILINEEAIIMHETKCRPDLFSLPPEPTQQKRDTCEKVIGDYFHDNEASSIQNESRIKNQSEVHSYDNPSRKENRSKNKFDEYSYDSEDIIRERNRSIHKQEARNSSRKNDRMEGDRKWNENSRFVRDFNINYDKKNGEEAEEKYFRSNLGQSLNEVKHFSEKDSTSNNRKETRSKYLEEKYKNKSISVTPVSIKYPENELSPRENAEMCQRRSYLQRPNVSTEPGEFLKNDLDANKLDLNSSKKKEKFTSDSTCLANSDSNSQNTDKLYYSWRKIDANNTKSYQQRAYSEVDKPNHSNRGKAKSSDKSDKVNEWMIANHANFDKNKDVDETEKKIYSTRNVNVSRDDSDPEDFTKQSSNFVNVSSAPSDRRNRMIYESDKLGRNECVPKSYSSKEYKKDVNAFHSMYRSQSDNDPPCDSDPESYKEVRDAADNRVSRSKAKQTETDSKHPNRDTNNLPCSERRGRDSNRESARKMNDKFTEHNIKENLHLYTTRHEQVDFFDRSSGDRSYHKYAKEVSKSDQRSVYPDVLENHSRQRSDTYTKGQEPMETDDDNNVLEKQTREAHDYFLFSKKIEEFSDPEGKDNDMDSYMQFLQIDGDKVEERKACRKCGNEMCICKIRKSLSTVRSNSFSAEVDDKDTHTFNANKTSKMRIKTYERSKDGKYYLKDMSSVDKKTNNQLDDQWKKYRGSIYDNE